MSRTRLAPPGLSSCRITYSPGCNVLSPMVTEYGMLTITLSYSGPWAFPGVIHEASPRASAPAAIARFLVLMVCILFPFVCVEGRAETCLKKLHVTFQSFSEGGLACGIRNKAAGDLTTEAPRRS